MPTPKRSPDLPLADSIGARIGPCIEEITIAGRTFHDIPVLWQDWSLHQMAEVERHWENTGRFIRYWLGLDDEADPDDDYESQAESLVEKAQRLNKEAEEEQKRPVSDTQKARLMNLGGDDIPVERQAEYLYLLLGPWDAELSDEDRESGAQAWQISVGWVMANVSRATLWLILAQIVSAQLEASAGELEAEAERGDHPKEDSSSGESSGDD